MPRIRAWALVYAACLARGAAAQEAQSQRYSPPSRSFTCDLPSPEWRAFDEADALGEAVHILGPDDPSGSFRAGIDVRWFEKGQPGFVPFKAAMDRMRRTGGEGKRASGAVAHLRVAGSMARIFELTESRLLPDDSLPAVPRQLHAFVALVPSGESYWVVKLASTRDVYLDYRGLFVTFLKSFKPVGSR